MVAAGGFLWAFGVSAKPLPAYLSGWRGWDDLAIASTYFRDRGFPVGPYEIANRYRRTSPEFRAFRRPLVKEFRERPVSEAWTSLDVTDLVGQRAFPVTRVDDAGRAFFLGALFRITGGIRPLFLVWLPITLVALALGWIVFELAYQGKTTAALVTAALFCLSGFFREASAQSYAAYGFYLAAGLGLLAFCIAMSQDLSLRSAWPRLAGASAILCLAFPARNAALLMIPGFLAAWMSAFRSERTWRQRVAALALALAALVGLPFVVEAGIDVSAGVTLKSIQRDKWPTPGSTGHDIWPTLWIGLGDFDRTKGHVYLDEAARAAVIAAGFNDRLEPGAQQHLRGVILGEITGDPLWFAEIVLKRASATFFLDKLRPMASTALKSYAPSSHPSEGAFDSYMELAPTADQFGWRRGSFEVPAFLLWAGWPLLGLLSVGPDRQKGRHLRILCPMVLGFLACPVIVTTASAIEMQAMAGVHFLAWGLALDRLVRRLTSPRP